MDSRKNIIIFYFAITIMAIGLCWNIYRTTAGVESAFSTFTEKELATLEHLFNFRAYLSEHERLLYEYYATVDRASAITRLAVVRSMLANNLEYLQSTFNNNKQCLILADSFEGLSEEYKQLDSILTSEKIDWDAARESLVRLTRHGQNAVPALDELFQNVRRNSKLTSDQVEARLNHMTMLVIGFVFVVLAIAMAAGYFIREMLTADYERKRLAFFPERNPNAVFRMSFDGEVEYQNPASHRMAARIDTHLQTVLPPDIHDWTSELHNSDNLSQSYEYTLCDHILSADLQYLPDLQRFHLYISDVTEQRKAEDELRFLAYYDPVSGLPNQRSFINDCNNWIYSGDTRSFSVMTIGFHRFEQSARHLGTEAVDELVKRIGKWLHSLLEIDSQVSMSASYLYRSTGASFIIAMHVNGNEDVYTLSHETANSIINKLVSEPLYIQRREVWLHPEIGASFCPDDANTPAQLLGNASAAMAAMAATGLTGYQPATPEIIHAEQHWIEIETALRQVLEQGELLLYYQPKIHTGNLKVTGMEALVRWDRRDKGIVSPMDFIPVAEESGLIISLGSWVLDQACGQASAWIDSGHSNFSIAVNISKLQLQQDNFVETVINTLNKYGLSPDVLDLEITESMLMQDLDRNLETLGRLRKTGVGLSLDDFGTGYSSLEYLHLFPVTQLKIDKSFIKNISNECRDNAIVRTIINLAHELDIKVVAEGVETGEQVEILKKLECDELQGYFFSKPLSTHDFENWWKNSGHYLSSDPFTA